MPIRNYPPNPQLAVWVSHQRRCYKLLLKSGKKSYIGFLMPKRIERLEAIDFTWDATHVTLRPGVSLRRIEDATRNSTDQVKT